MSESEVMARLREAELHIALSQAKIEELEKDVQFLRGNVNRGVWTIGGSVLGIITAVIIAWLTRTIGQ